jgi:hyperpolarization activated cyclic nucleotide-gated potassium channel 2
MDTEPMTWITKAKIENKSNSEKYITSLYWAFTTMTTVGYGDITAITINEKIYAMFSMIVACGVFAYTVGSIGSLVSKQNAMENAYREQVVAVNRYMRKKELPYDLQFRVRRYLEYVWENKKRNNLDEKQILKLLSEPLRDEIYAQIHGDIIKKCPIFSDSVFEAHFLNQVTRALEGETYAPGDTVIEEGEMSTKMYFIQNGKVDIFHHSTKSTFKELKNGDYFGEIAFFSERPRCASAKCLDFVDLLSLSRNSMNDILERFPEAKKKVNELNKACEENRFDELGVRCYVCDKKGHFAIKCTKILLNVDRDETRNNWLEKRKNALQKNVKPEDENKPNFQRFSRKRIKIPVKLRNVIGMKQPNGEIFPEKQELNSKLTKYLARNSADDRPANLELQRPFPVNRPKYTLIYKDSEGSAEGGDEEVFAQEIQSDDEQQEKNLKIFEDSNLGSPFDISSLESNSKNEKERGFSDLVGKLSRIEIPDFNNFERESDGKSVEFSAGSPVNLLVPPKSPR